MKPILSVIIVNYNVKYFIEQALVAVKQAAKGMAVEIIIVDNASHDGSVEMIRHKFSQVHLIENKENKGFSRANNQGIKVASGKYILLLNPDTVVQEDTFEKSIAFMDAHPEAGALGVKMIDGKGNFLPESKRGLPTPKVAFFKNFGLSALFPQSHYFNHYHLGYLDENENHEVEVLAGAFMLIRKNVLDKIGGLDEDYFMYGEDIDLSYRITQLGYKNYYLAETKIIHYKGESTKKGSLNYVKIFYQAMLIFAQKHYSKKQALQYVFLIQTAVYLRAFLSGINRFLSFFLLPLIDSLMLYGGMYFIKNFWEENLKQSVAYYPPQLMLYIVPAYIAAWLLAVFFSGGYDRPLQSSRIIRGIIVGTLAIAILYAFLPDSLRFSRALIILGAIWAIGSMISYRNIIKIIFRNKTENTSSEIPKIIIVGKIEECKRALQLMMEADVRHRLLGFVLPDDTKTSEAQILGTLDELEDINSVYAPHEIIFCSRDISYQNIISFITILGTKLNYKIIPENSNSIIGSNSKNTAGDLYAIDMNLNIISPMSRRNKRLFDLLISFLILIFLPYFILKTKKISSLLQNVFSVLTGLKTWVGFDTLIIQNTPYQFPKIKPGIIPVTNSFKHKKLNASNQLRLNLLYAKDYSIYKDWEIWSENIEALGQI